MNATQPEPTAQSAPRRRCMTARLRRRESLGADYHVLTFDVPGALDAHPGQFLMLRGADWGSAPLLPRPMSFLSAGSAPSILIRVVGDATRRLAGAAPGESFQLVGPLGNWWPAVAPHRRPLLVAGGVGIAPLLFLARSLAAAGARPVAAYGARSERDLPLRDALAEVAELHTCTEDGSSGSRGLVTAELQRILQPEVHVFTCGPEPMLAKVAELCAAAAVPCEVSLEAPMACGFGVCLGCAVPTLDGHYLYACTEGPCVDARRIDWNRACNTKRRSIPSRTEKP
jgi:dihydroorotate dehydrogenase electron transfer subunit